VKTVFEKIKKFVSHPIASLACIFCLTFLAYSNIFTNDFVMDDFDFIVDWPLIQNLNNAFRFFAFYIPPDGQIGIYSPLKTLFHALNYALFKTDVFGYHVVSLLIHSAGIFFVYRIASLLTSSLGGSAFGGEKKRIAFIAALIFALHPVQTEAITYMTASVDMIGIVFLFAAFFYFARMKTSCDYPLSILLAVSAVFTHELAVSLPFLFLLYESTLRPGKKQWESIFKKVLPYFLIVILYVLAKFLTLGTIARGGYLYDSFYLTMLVSIKRSSDLILIVFVPFALTVNHIISPGIFSYDMEDFDKFAVLSQSFLDPQVLVSLLAIGVIVYFAFRFYVKKPIILFCVGWFFISLLPVLNIVPSSIYFGERYLYPGLLGFSLLVAILISSLVEGKGARFKKGREFIGFALVFMLVFFYGFRTYVRNFDWQDEVVFYESMAANNQESVFLKRDLGIIYMKNAMPVQAIEILEKASQLKPQDPDILFVLAESYAAAENYKKAKDILEKAVGLNPEFAEGYYNLAVVLAELDQVRRSYGALHKAVDLYQKQNRFLEAYQGEDAFHRYFILEK